MTAIELNEKVIEIIKKVISDYLQNESVKKQFLQLIQNVVNDNYDRSDMIRMIEALKLENSGDS